MTLDVDVDIGAVDNVRRKALFLVVHRENTTYTVSLGVKGELLVTRRNPSIYGYERVAPENEMFSRVVAYALRRAICRGIDIAETHETDVAVLIDLGELPACSKVPW